MFFWSLINFPFIFWIFFSGIAVMNFDSRYPNFVTKNKIQQKFMCGLHILLIGIESKHSLLSVYVFLQGINDIMYFFQEFLLISSKTSACGHNIKASWRKLNAVVLCSLISSDQFLSLEIYLNTAAHANQIN